MSRDLAELFRRPYASGEVWDFLDGYYQLDKRGLAGSLEQHFAGNDYVLRGCNQCRAVTQELAPDEDFAAEIYGNWIDGKGSKSTRLGNLPRDAENFKEHSHAIQEALILTAFLLRHRRKKVPGELKILDYGAGWGRFALAMRACGCQVHVFEFAQDRAQSARDNGLTVTLTAEMAGQSYDFINTEQVFEHLPEPRETAMLLHSALDRQGVLKISVPFARWAETGRIEIDWTAGRYSKNSGTPFHPLEHLTYFRRPSLQLMAQDLGMTETRHQAYEQLGYSFDWIGLRSAARNLARLLPRRWFRNYFFFVKE